MKWKNWFCPIFKRDRNSFRVRVLNKYGKWVPASKEFTETVKKINKNLKRKP